MAQQTAVLVPSARIVRWQPPAAAEDNEFQRRAAWRDNVTRQQDLPAIWPRHELNAPWVAYVPTLDGMFLEVTDTSELGRFFDKLAVVVAQRDAQREQAA